MIMFSISQSFFSIAVVYLLWLCGGRLRRLRRLGGGDSRPLNIGFFHPFCNSGGGGERVLWTIIRAIQLEYQPAHVRCCIYTGDIDASPQDILSKVESRFGIVLPFPSAVEFIYLRRRYLVDDALYPHFTLLLQSLASVLLGLEAFHSLVPDIYFDTMGYAFTYPLFKIFGGCHVVSYTHYPTISSDMLTHSAPTYAKYIYYYLFSILYGLVGGSWFVDVALVNSSWTKAHIDAIWLGSTRSKVVYPPCDTVVLSQLPLSSANYATGGTADSSALGIISIGQFRPEKNHSLQVRAFGRFLGSLSTESRRADGVRFMIVGSCRNHDDQRRVDELRDLIISLDLDKWVEIHVNVPYSTLKHLLSQSTIGIHTMWNEHFGIGVVEYQAAGCIPIAHRSGGPLLDIVVDYEGSPTGFLADSEETYAEALKRIIIDMSAEERQAIQLNARKSASTRFTADLFEQSILLELASVFSARGIAKKA